MPYSTYSRIRELLSRVAKQQPVDIFELSKSIHDEPVESFAIWRRGTEGVSVKEYCSPTAIRRRIRFVAELDLFSIENNKTVRLTGKGQNALQGNNFDAQLSTQLKIYLENHGTTFQALVTTIKRVKPPSFPDRHTVLEQLRAKGLSMDDDRFRVVINLFVRTHDLDSRIRRLFSERRK